MSGPDLKAKPPHNAKATGGVRKAQAAERRRLLLEAALELFSERGYRNASVRELTRATGVTEAVLYHYFENKAGVLKAVLSEYAPFARISEVAEAQSSAPLESALQELALAIMSVMTRRRQLMLTMLSESAGDPELASMFSGFLTRFTDNLGQFLTVRQDRGEIAADADTRSAAQSFVGALLVRFLTTALSGQGDLTAERDDEFAAQLAASLCRGLLPVR